MSFGLSNAIATEDRWNYLIREISWYTESEVTINVSRSNICDVNCLGKLCISIPPNVKSLDLSGLRLDENFYPIALRNIKELYLDECIMSRDLLVTICKAIKTSKLQTLHINIPTMYADIIYEAVGESKVKNVSLPYTNAPFYKKLIKNKYLQKVEFNFPGPGMRLDPSEVINLLRQNPSIIQFTCKVHNTRKKSKSVFSNTDDEQIFGLLAKNRKIATQAESLKISISILLYYCMRQYNKTIFQTPIIRIILKLVPTDHPAWILLASKLI